MTRTCNVQDNPDPGTKEEDRSDPDVDSGTEKEVEAVHAAAERPIQQWQPPACRWRGIPESLYDKAYDDPDQLSQEERQILLSRGVANYSMSERQPLVQPTFGRPPRDPADRLPDHLESYREQLEAVEDAFMATLRHRSDTAWKGAYRPVPDGDRNAPGPWPSDHDERTGAFRLFEQDAEPGCCGSTLNSPEWYCLPEDQKAVYRARAEALRCKAWVEFEMACAAKGPPAPGSIRRNSGFEHFRLGPGLDEEFQEVLGRWEAFTEAQRRGWEMSALHAFGEAQTRKREMWEMRDLRPEEKQEAQAPPPQGRKRYESVEAWKARRAMERRPAAGREAQSVQDLAQNLAVSSIADSLAEGGQE